MRETVARKLQRVMFVGMSRSASLRVAIFSSALRGLVLHLGGISGRVYILEEC